MAVVCRHVHFSGGASIANSLRVCIIGSGPAGFYTAHQLIKRHPDSKVDIVERLPLPFGLVRFGVAPDHPEVKNCINQFTTLAKSDACRFIGNVCFGKDITLTELKQNYHAVVMAYGAEDDRVLGIPGEDLSGVHSARAFVGWYNGLPAHKHLNPDLSVESAVVLGQGNVALDVARILLTPIDILRKTDICEHALDALAESRIRRVQIIGRRGPLQVAFTIKELREMTKLPGCKLRIDPKDFADARELLTSLPRPRKRITELMIKTADADSASPTGSVNNLRECGLSFLRSPVELTADSSTGKVSGVRIEINKLEGDWESAKAIGTGQFEEEKCGLVLRSIGYRTLPVEEEVPYDHKLGIVPNVNGRVTKKTGDATVLPGLYCSGWVKTGPVGVILTTMSNAFETAEAIVDDYDKGRLASPESPEDLVSVLSSKSGVHPTTFSDWEKIDTVEQSEGQRLGKPREKVTSIERMLDIISQP